MLNTLRAEWTKLITTRSLWWTSGLFLVMTIGFAIIVGATSTVGDPLTGSLSVLSVTGIINILGFPVLMVQAVMVVTTEYRYGLQTLTYMASPRRWQVALVKLGLYAALSALLVIIGVVGAFIVSSLAAPGPVAEAFDPWNDEMGRRILWVYPLGAALLTLFSQGLGLLLRQTAGAVTLGLILYLGIDSFTTFFPAIGDKIVHFMPFSAFSKWLMNMPPQGAMWDSITGYFFVFLGWSLILWLLGVLLLNKRDA